AEAKEPQLPELLERLDCSSLDLVLVEGFRHLQFPKIELHRPALGKPLLFTEDSSVIAIASDAPIGHPCELPQLDLNNPQEIAQFVTNYCNSQS
ncbi:MAG: molybdopterin-guanine dinucleotide biosynthesis protein MobB, partial [Candidatus Thiodiazotropha taylori]